METINIEDFALPRVAVPLPGGKQFMVRGLCADDLALMVSLHLHEIVKALELYREQKGNIMASGSLAEFVMTFVRDFPAVATEVISAAADAHTDKAREVIGKLPITVQLAALNEITKLTMEDAGGLKNLLAEMRERLVRAAPSDGTTS